MSALSFFSGLYPSFSHQGLVDAWDRTYCPSKTFLKEEKKKKRCCLAQMYSRQA
jgi:hypothetical protein